MPGDDGWWTHPRLPATAFRPSDAQHFRPRKGVGNAGCDSAPAASRAKMKKHTSKSPRVHRDHPAFPHANGFNGLWRALPSAMRKHCRRVDASVEASGPHAFAVREPVVVFRRAYVHRIPCPTFRDDREAPLMRAGTVRIPKDDLPDGESEIFLEKGLDSESEARGVICPSGKWGPERSVALSCLLPSLL
jgi:hypothetical protein